MPSRKSFAKMSYTSFDSNKIITDFIKTTKNFPQFVAGIGLPVDLEPEALTIGYVFKAQYFLPYNVSQLTPTRLSRDIKEDEVQHQNNDYEIEIDHGTDTDDGVRWSIYQVLDIFLRRQMKIDGRQCVLRAICEAVQIPFTFESGLLGELMHILLV